jgi:sigma-B regulation protein RsbU (phosphoserine phosphatase)
MAINSVIDDQLHQLEAKLEVKKADLRDLATMGAVVTSIHEIGAVLSVAMEMALRLVNGEVGSILLDEGGHLSSQISWGVKDSLINGLKYHDELDLVSYCFEHREPVIQTDLGARSEEGLRVDSVICQPIQTAQRCFGLILILNKADGSNYTDEDREILEMLMNFVAVAIDNSMLMKEKLQRLKIEQEMVIAKQIQETILPANINAIKGAEIGAIYFPAQDVGGDFYDVIKIDESSFIVVMGDVSNKGVPAALIMSAAAAIIKSTIIADPEISVSDLAEKTNNLLSTEIIKDREMFVTLFFCRFDTGSGKLSYCNAGHIPGMLWDSKEKRVVSLPEGGPIIGQFPGISYRQGERSVGGGDRLLLFTDGLTEAADKDDQLFGMERVENVFRDKIELSPMEFCMSVKKHVDQFAEGCCEESVDDFTILQVSME